MDGTVVVGVLGFATVVVGVSEWVSVSDINCLQWWWGAVLFAAVNFIVESGARVEVSLRVGVFSSLAASTLDGVAILTPGYIELSSSTSAMVGFP